MTENTHDGQNPSHPPDPLEPIYRKILAIQTENPAIVRQLEWLFQQIGQPMAEQLPRFLHNLGVMQMNARRWQPAADCFQELLRRQPHHPEALYWLAHCWRHLNRQEEAITCYRRLIALQPLHSDAHLCLGNLLWATDQEQAIACFRAAVVGNPDHPNGHTRLGDALAERGEFAEAIPCYRQALALQPTLCEALDGLGKALQQAGRLEEAVDCWQQAATIRPDFLPAHHNQGGALYLLGRPEEAEACYCAALAIQPRPETHYQLARIRVQRGALPEALRGCQDALALQEGYLPAWRLLGQILLREGRSEEAVACYQQAMLSHPDDPELLVGLGDIWMGQGQLAEAITCYRRVPSSSPDWMRVQCNLLFMMLHLCLWTEMDSRHQQMMARFHAGQPGASPSIFLVLPTSPAEQKRCAEQFCASHHPVQPPLASNIAPSGSAPLKVGYLSYDYRSHPCGQLLAELFAHHDRQQVELFVYACNADDGSVIRQQIQDLSDRFVDLSALGCEAAARRIHADRVQLLVELNGFTTGPGLGIAAWRPAPLQLSWLGLSTTVGAPFMDYCLTDSFMAPPGAEAFFTEKLIRLPCNLHFRRAADPVTPTRQACGLPEAGFVFVCFNQHYKISPPLFDGWMELLRRLPEAVLWLREFNAWSMANLRREAEKRGVEPARLVFAGRTDSLAAHVARYRLADLALDTHPYGSGSTGWDLLSAGCPMVSCAGQTGMSRYSGSQLVHCGLADLVTDSLSDYVALALALANDPPRLQEVRRRLQRQLPTAPLFDAHRFAGHLQQAYRTVWQRLQAGLPTDHIEIEG
ncbi:MAG: tetratricopeptide repeat protein [Magnetococcus sp. MYC-9]